MARGPLSPPTRPGAGRPALGLALAVAWLLAQSACGGGGAREAIQIPATSTLRGATELLLPRVETRDGAPDWVHRPRLDEGFVYGVGIQPGRRSPDQSLYGAMSSARSAIVAWLEARGARAESPKGLNPPLEIDDESIAYERLAHDPEADRWYALARLEIAAASARIEDETLAIEGRIRRAQARVLDTSLETDDRIRAALALLYAMDRRAQYAAAYHALSAKRLPTAADLTDSVLQEQADDLLSIHGVRILVEGPDVPGLHGSVSSAMSRVHIRSDEFGPGLVVVRIVESNSFRPGNPYLEVDGQVEVAIEGGDARSYTTAFHVVSSGIDDDEARFRAARTINLEVERIVTDTLRTIAESES